MDAPQTLRVLIIPFSAGQIVLPNSAVMEVLPFAPALPVDSAPIWVLGNLLWRSRPIPLVSLERLFYDQRPETGVRTRIVIVNTLGENQRLTHFGFLSTDVPRGLSLEPHDLVPDEAGRTGNSILNTVKMGEETLVIPDLDSIEQALRPVVK